MAFPIPSKENAASMMGKVSPSRGRHNASTVTPRLTSTVFFLPILFMSMLVGMLKNRNQKKTSEGKTFATESLSCKSSFT